MRRYILQTPSGPDGRKSEEVETPTAETLKEGKPLIRIYAVSLNYRDLILSQNPRQKTPLVPLSDGAGEVVAVGEGVSRVAMGAGSRRTFSQRGLMARCAWRGKRRDVD